MNYFLIFLKKYIIYTLLTFIGFCCTSKNEKEAAEFFERGNYHFKKNELEKAQTFFQEAIKKQPNLADAYNNLGLIFEKKEKTSEANLQYKKAIEIDPDFFEASFNLSRTESLLGRNKNALQILETLSKSYIDSAKYYNERGQVYWALQNFDLAEKDFINANLLQPHAAATLINLGVISYQKLNFDSAKKYFLEAQSINPNEAFVFHNLSILAIHSFKFNEALSFAEKAESLNKKSEIIKNNLVFCHLLLNQIQEAEEIKKGIKNETHSSYFLRNEGILFLKQGKNQIALEKFEEAEKIDPSTEYIYFFLVDVEGKLNNEIKKNQYLKIGKQLNDPFLLNGIHL